MPDLIGPSTVSTDHMSDVGMQPEGAKGVEWDDAELEGADVPLQRLQ
jgi:hypothetical protein